MKRTVIPGLNDSHLHVIRGGLNYNMELRWDGVPSLADALRLYTQGRARFSSETGRKDAIVPGQMADMAVLSEDYFTVPEEEIKGTEAVLTIMDGRIVHAAGPYKDQAPTPIPVLPEWSPIAVFGGYGAPLDPKKAARAGVPFLPEHRHSSRCRNHGCMHSAFMLMEGAANAARPRHSDFWGSGCGCFAF